MSDEVEHNTLNEFIVLSGQNLPNHSSSMNGRGRFVRIGEGTRPIRTKQEAYRLCAHVLAQAATLPDEDVPSTFEEVMAAVRNT